MGKALVCWPVSSLATSSSGMTATVDNPGDDQRHTVEATARLIPLLRAKGYVFGGF